ncbi:MAG TPA: PAS domain-containing protein [Steroidobacteraceae bacterium]
MQTAIWILLALPGLLAGCGAWLQLKSRLSQASPENEAHRSQALLEQLTTATQAAGIYCWELDWETSTVSLDVNSLPTAGAPGPTFDAELTNDLHRWVDPMNQHAARDAILQALALGERQCSFSYQLMLADQSVRHIEVCVDSEADRDGKLRRSIGVSRDVTGEIDAAERAARDASMQRELLERLSLATHAAGLQCFEFDFRSRKMMCIDYRHGDDDSPEEAWKPGEARIASVFPEDFEDIREASMAAIARHDRIMSIRYRSRDPDGSVRYIQSYHHFFYDQDGNATRALGANIDITESHLRQIELEALSVRFAIATRAAHAGVWEWRESTEELWWNDTMYEIHGLPVNSPLPSREGLIAMIHPDDRLTAQSMRDSAMSGADQMKSQFRVIRPDGEIVHVKSVAVWSMDTTSSERRLVGITLDISKRIAAEQRERQLQKQLLDASHQAGMAEVATGVLHNVGNVLNSLGVSCATARARLRGSHFDRLERVAAMLEANQHTLEEFFASDPRGQHFPLYLAALGERLREDVNDLGNEFDAIDAHFQYLRKIVHAQQSFARGSEAEEAVSLVELVEMALELTDRELGNAQIVRDIPDLPEIWTNRYKLLQIIVTFIDNATDAIAESEPERRRLAVRARLTGPWFEIAVEDSGVGMPPDRLELLWQLGFTTKAHGHGFGLHSAAIAAQQLGGSVAASSPGPGQGARFSVRIPARSSHSHTSAERKAC